ncbi:MAG: DJ-1/PfpI family protein [Burkholderiaceae bacterium]|jgi:putative intracellular protease/amidase|nr:DJ-1/PfpI family protein [Burkholderiaceae bacterium]
MASRARALIAASIASLWIAGCGTDVPLPPTQSEMATSEQHNQVFVDALKPRHSGKPVIAVLASNEGTEMTDLLLPHAVLVRTGVADVRVVAPRSGRVTLYPALQIDGGQDFASFDRANPAGADYVIVPAMGDGDVPEVITWLREQVDRGARVLAVCSGALVAGRAGLLDGRRFTGHWYDRDTLLEHAGATYVPHQRYVIDRGVATTTGITASVPATLALVEAIGGREKAQAIATELGVRSWTPQHDSSRFGIDVRRGWQYVMNRAAFWRDETRTIDVHDGVDDVALALAADAWSRTGHVKVKVASSSRPVTMRSGLVLVPQALEDDGPRMTLASALGPVRQLDRTLCEIEERFGESQREWVMLEMEYTGSAAECAG